MRVALVCFNRPDYLFRVLSALRDLAKVEPLDIVVGVDGPRPGNENDAAKVAEVLKILDLMRDSGGFQGFRVHAREKNLGCWANKKQTIAQAFEGAEHVLVLEDDIVPCADAVDFLKRLVAADVFANPNLFQISLFSYFFPAGMAVDDVAQRMRQEDAFGLVGFRKWATPWGWLTRKDRWERIRNDWNGWDQWLGKYCSENEMFEIFPLVSKCNNIGVVGLNRTGGDAIDFQRRALVSDDVVSSFGLGALGPSSVHPLTLNYASIAELDKGKIRSIGDAVYRYGVSLHPASLVGTGVF